MNYWPTNHNKKSVGKRLSVEFKKPLCHSEKNDNEQKSDDSNIEKETLNLFKGIVKVTQKTFKQKKTPETQSNSINNNNIYCNNIFDFTNRLYNDEEHLNEDKDFIVKNNGNSNSIKYKKFISPSDTLKSKNKLSNRSRSSLEILNLSKNIPKEQNLKTSLFNKNSNRFHLNFYNNNVVKKKIRRGSVMGDMTHKNRNNRNLDFFFKLKEKEKTPSKTPYLDKIWNFSNQLSFKPKTNIHTKKGSNLSLTKQNSKEINNIKISRTNIKPEKEIEEEEEIIPKLIDKKEKDKNEETPKKNNENKIEENDTENLEKKEKIIFSEEKVKKTNIVFNILNKPFFCCLK